MGQWRLALNNREFKVGVFHYWNYWLSATKPFLKQVCRINYESTVLDRLTHEDCDLFGQSVSGNILRSHKTAIQGRTPTEIESIRETTCSWLKHMVVFLPDDACADKWFGKQGGKWRWVSTGSLLFLDRVGTLRRGRWGGWGRKVWIQQPAEGI